MTIGNDRGSYGSRGELVGARSFDLDRFAELPPDYTRLGVAAGVGLLVGILIGTNVTFHLPVRRRR